MDIEIHPAKSLRGTFKVPGDKSISHRALLISSLAKGKSEIEGLSDAADPKSTLHCIEKLGVQVEQKGEKTVIWGKGKRGYKEASGSLDCGNSGTTMRLLAGILAGQNFSSELVGDDSLSRRPMERIMTPLAKMGARIKSSPRFTAPLTIEGVERLSGIDYELPVASAQVKSAVLFAGLFAEGTTRVIENQPSRDHTERMLGLHSEIRDGRKVTSIDGGNTPDSRRFFVPGDISSAAYFIAAALVVPNSELLLQEIGLNPTRIAFLEALKNVGSDISTENNDEVSGEPIGNVIVKTSSLRSRMHLHGKMIPQAIDEIPVLAVTAALAGMPFKLQDAKELRSKESDRIKSIVENLRKIGVDVEESDDGFEFEEAKNLHGAVVDSFHDHRIAMAFGIAGLKVPGVVIRNAECVGISFPGFWNLVQQVSEN